LKSPLNPKQNEFALLIESAGWSQAEAARQLQLSRSAVSQILSGKNTPDPQTLELLRSRVLAHDLERRSKSALTISETAPPYKTAVTVDKRTQGKAPVVSWASAGRGGSYADLADFLEEWVETDCKDANKYALIVEGDSMEPRFSPGDRIVVAPNVEARNGNVVVARVRETGQVFFKLFHETTKGMVRLTSYNPAYPPLEFSKEDFRFIHPVYSSTKKLM
jgi:phage repressor protein C with HTH and peptisase S24 domain